MKKIRHLAINSRLIDFRMEASITKKGKDEFYALFQSSYLEEPLLYLLPSPRDWEQAVRTTKGILYMKCAIYEKTFTGRFDPFPAEYAFLEEEIAWMVNMLKENTPDLKEKQQRFLGKN